MKYTLTKEQLIGALIKSYELSNEQNGSRNWSIQKYKYYLEENIDAVYSNIIAQSWSKDDENE